MQQVWFKNAKSQEDKLVVRTQLKTFKNAFEALDELLVEMEEVPSKNDYDCPSWSHKQADINGANRMLREVRKLINIKD